MLIYTKNNNTRNSSANNLRAFKRYYGTKASYYLIYQITKCLYLKLIKKQNVYIKYDNSRL